MNSMGREARGPDAEQAVMHEYFSGLFEGAVLMPVDDGSAEINNLRRHGLGMAEILFQEGGVCYATYIIEETPSTEALREIYQDEYHGKHLPAGSHAKAVDHMAKGTFEQNWSAYMAQHKNQ